ncbi:MAG TPA: hypothetical protein VGQ46_11720 [Thermoanaerobaculia bacterium]|nr:hypothetical protein [Thermoanaerobaculia bacterium]
MTTNDIVQTSASVATAVGVLLAWSQIRITKNQAISTFEDELSRQYREIVGTIPLEAILGETLDKEIQRSRLANFYRYLDLTNEQVFLRQQGRVRKSTWSNWAEGIRTNLSRPAFAAAWEEIKRRAPGSFTELRRLEDEQFAVDPRNWRSAE